MNRFEKPLMRVFELAARFPLLTLAVVLGMQTLFTLDCRELWYSDEIRHANVFEHLIRENKWIVLYLNGEFYPDKPPLYFWFLSGLRFFVGHEAPSLFFLAAAITGYFYVVATYCLVRIVLKGSKELGLTAGLVLLSTFYFVGLTHYARMDLLFATLILFSQITLFKAWEKIYSPSLCILGFSLAGLATLTKGPLGLAFPLVSSVAYLAWQGRFKRLLTRDAAMGLGAAVGILLLWLAAVLLIEDPAYLKNVLVDQVYRRATDTWHHEQSFFHYFLTLPGALMPWTLLLLVGPVLKLWRRNFLQNFWRDLWRGRTFFPPGDTYVWWMWISGLLLLSAVSIKIVIYLLPIFAPMAVLIAKSLLRTLPVRSQRLFLCIAAIFGVLALVLPFANLFHPWPIHIKGTIICAILAGGAAWVLYRYIPRHNPKAALAALVILLTIWLIPTGRILAPSLDPIMSPKAQAHLLREYIQNGYTPVVYKVYSGTYSYYAGQNLPEVDDMAIVVKTLETSPKTIIAMREKYWRTWENRPETLEKVHEQWIADRVYVLLAQDSEDSDSAQ